MDFTSKSSKTIRTPPMQTAGAIYLDVPSPASSSRPTRELLPNREMHQTETFDYTKRGRGSSSSADSTNSPKKQDQTKRYKDGKEEVLIDFLLHLKTTEMDTILNKIEDLKISLNDKIGRITRAVDNNSSHFLVMKQSIGALAQEMRIRNVVIIGIPEIKEIDTDKDDMDMTINTISQSMKLDYQLDYDGIF